ncbi:hypothetical protein ACSP97_05575 [Streptomyces sp. SCPE 10]|uniref:hypothetical protein n=1 Tax=Streptomyces sp. SCPE 10 TaxID=3449273 RepID=UPI003F7CE487
MPACRDLSRGALEVQRGLLRHTPYPEAPTHRLAVDWTTYRHQRRPASSHPHPRHVTAARPGRSAKLPK